MSISNTARDQREHVELARATGIPIGHFIAPGAIEAQEARGQTEVVNSTLIPTDMRDPSEEFEALGFVLGEIKADDPMWREATLPEGWAREGSDHAMWSYIVDAEGYRRCSIFYKAAFYDRSAFIGINATPQTAAQADAWNTIAPGRDEMWMSGRGSRREGPNYVYSWFGRYGDNAPEGKTSYSDDGRRREVVIAPDGSEVSRREFEVEPTSY